MKLKNYPRIYCPNCKAIIGNVSDRETKKACDIVIVDKEAVDSGKIANSIFITCPKCKTTIAIGNNSKSVPIPETKIGVGATA